MPAVSLTGLESDTSHLVIGATGNVGPYLIRQLAEMGASTVVAVSRRGGPQLEELAAELSSGGTTLVEVAADAADEAAMTALFARFGKDLPPLEGIYLAALAGGEALLSEMTDDDVNTMFRSKLDVASVLHKLSLKTRCADSCCSPRSRAFSARDGSAITPRPTRSSTHSPTRAAPLDSRQRSSTGACGSRGRTHNPGRRPPACNRCPTTSPSGCCLRCSVRTPCSPRWCAADWSRLADAYRMRGSLRVVDHLLADAAVRRTEHRRCARARARHLARRAGHRHGTRTPVARATGARRQAVSGRSPGPRCGSGSGIGSAADTFGRRGATRRRDSRRHPVRVSDRRRPAAGDPRGRRR